MNEKLQYAAMLEIPVNTANVTFKHVKKKRAKRKRRASPEEIKELLMEKVNGTEDSAALPQVSQETGDITEISENPTEETAEITESAEILSSATVRTEKKKRFRGFSLVTAELILIGILTATIFITNAVYSDSAINTFVKSVFGTSETETAVKNYDDYKPVINFGGASEFSLDEGYLTSSGSGAVYAPVDGVVSALSKAEDGLYDVEIKISDNFVAVFSGLKYAYAEVGDKVYGNIPVGYVEEQFKMCFKSGDGTVITDYTVENGAVLWAV